MHLQGSIVVEHRAMLCPPLSRIYPLEALDGVYEVWHFKRGQVRSEHAYFMRVDAINGN